MKKITTMVSLLALASSPALAQPGLALFADGDSGDDIVVSASRSGEGIPADQLGASVTLLDSRDLRNRQTRVVSDILRDVPGVAVNRSGGVGGQTAVRLRGAEGNQVLVLIDGMEAADPFQGEFDFGTLIADPEARIEVLRGQQSSLYGSDAIGGVIHYITLSGAEAPGFSLRAEGGSFSTYNASARAAGVSGDLDYAVTATYFHSGGHPTARFGTRDIGSDYVTVSGKANWQASDNLAVSAVARYNRNESDTNNQSFDGSSPLLGLVVDSPGNDYDSEAIYGLLAARFSSSDDAFTAALTAQIADTKRTSRSSGIQSSGSEGQRLKGSLETSYRIDTGAMRHRLTAAVDLEREKFQNTFGAFGAFRGQLQTDNVGVVGQYELLMDESLSLGASVRRDFNDRFEDATTYRVQASYALPTGTRIRGAYGTGIKNPTYYELFGSTDRYIGNPGLKPEKSKGWEVGLEQSFAGERAVIGATYFDSELQNEIFTIFGFPSTSDNRDTMSRQKGVEVFVRADPIPQVSLDAAYTYLDAEENGAIEIRRPRHIGSFNATVYSPDERFAGTLSLRYNGRQLDNAFIVPPFGGAQLVELKEYVLVNMNAEYAITPRITIYGRIENAIDEDYEDVFSYATAGRAAYGGVRVTF